MEREAIIRRYFHSWIEQDRTGYDEIFHENIVYSECYGPEYHGLAQIKRWFDDWNQTGQVLEWTIHNLIFHNEMAVAEWYFRCRWEGQVSGFNGCSIMEFNSADQIVSLKEFESKAEHCYPYGK